MKKNTQELTGNKENKRDEGFYTIIDRYIEFCKQAHLDSGQIKWNDRYINGWFSY